MGQRDRMSSEGESLDVSVWCRGSARADGGMVGGHVRCFQPLNWPCARKKTKER